MKKLFLLVILLFVFNNIIIARPKIISDNIYNVISYSGDVQIKTGNKNWEKVTVGKILTDLDMVKIPNKCYLTLYDKHNQQYFIIQGDRTLKLIDLRTKPTASKSKNMFDFVSQVFNDFTSFFSGSITDSVLKTRLRELPTDSKRPIAISPKKNKILSDNIIFRWSKNGPENKYRFILLDETFKVIIDTIVQTNNLEFKKLSRTMEPDKEYIWQVIPEKGGREYKELNIFKFVSKEESGKIVSQIDSLDNFVGTKKDANSLILKGLFFEENEYFADALENYLAAIKINSSESRYVKLVERLFGKLKINLTYSQVFNN
jgi:hypothetical protein